MVVPTKPWPEPKKKPVYCHSTSDIPREPHYAVIEFETITEPGWGREDPCQSRQVPVYIVFPDRGSWEEEIRARTGHERKGNFVALFVQPAKVEVAVSIAVNVGAKR